MELHALLTIDGRPEEPLRFSAPEMSLSSARASMQAHDFELHVPQLEVTPALLSAYANWVAESKLDDAQCGAPQDDLARAGYPPLDRLVGDADLALLVLGRYLRDDLFAAFCSTGSAATVFWLDTVDACVVHGGTIVFRGVCYS